MRAARHGQQGEEREVELHAGVLELCREVSVTDVEGHRVPAGQANKTIVVKHILRLLR